MSLTNSYPKMVAFKQHIWMELTIFAKEHLEKVIFRTHAHAADEFSSWSTCDCCLRHRWLSTLTNRSSPEALASRLMSQIKPDLGLLGSATIEYMILHHLFTCPPAQSALISGATQTHSRAWTATTQSTQALLQFASSQCLQDTWVYGFFYSEPASFYQQIRALRSQTWDVSPHAAPPA